ncbi:MAG TPA: DUF1553 domain-containing protein [Planctomycetaceae bacterium]|nr:DUF1553 domain-containing protein [Planctomycetaceae bacterium]
MSRRSVPFLVATACVLLAGEPVTAEGPEASRIDFSRDVRPILAKNCFACHGPDDEHREAGLRLDLRDAALGQLDSGSTAIVPGKPDQSELYRRVTAEDEFERMPPPDSGRRLTPDDIAALGRWIEGGASYAGHWAFARPARPPLPGVKAAGWPRNGIDHFILARLERVGLAPSPEADPYALVRRVSLDLRGLPAAPAEVDEFVSDSRADAYERMVDRFLADPAFGERWARVWLDLARYADSRGYGSDPLRPHIWRYRDWVIEAFNRNLPYDQFTIEQLAGDLVGGATDAAETNPQRQPGQPADEAAGHFLDPLVATAFHRNTMTNTEGGTDDEEFRVAAVKDRINTTMQVWMGLTAGCAQCHNHKFDPLSQREYYSLYAIFNQTADADRGDEFPTLPAPTPLMLAEADRIDRRIAGLQRQLETPTPALADEQQTWEGGIRSAAGQKIAGRFVRIELPGREKILSLAEVQVFSGEANVAPAGQASQSSTAFGGKPERAIDGNTDGRYAEANSTTHTRNESDPWWEVDLGGARPIDRIVVWNRTDHDLHQRLAGFRLIVLGESRQTVVRQEIAEAPHPSREIALDGPRSAVPAELLPVIDLEPDLRTAEEREQLAAHFRSIAPSLKPVRDEIARLETAKPEFPLLPVMQELPPDRRRTTHVMLKGNFLSPGEAVEPAFPEAFRSPRPGGPIDRLVLARWLVDDDNPLTARVAVNRFWARIFGVGLVETEEDFGTQGELPSHPELLDWLALEFVGGTEDRGSRNEDRDDRPASQADQSTKHHSPLITHPPRAWDIKRLLKLIVTSAAYRQSSRITAELLAADPHNRLLARAPRFRLEAETVRDQALALSGLVSRKLGGPSVYPPQPEGLWRAAFNGERTWATSEGADRYRRGLYTFWRRTIPYPSMAAFDAPSREICTVRRAQTNTPLQAFVTLNDPVYVEAAQSLARRILSEGGATPDERVAWALRACLSRPAESDQVAALTELYRSELDHYRQHTEAARSLATDPLGPLPEGVDPAEAAAWTVVANVLLNLDGVLTRG